MKIKVISIFAISLLLIGFSIESANAATPLQNINSINTNLNQINAKPQSIAVDSSGSGGSGSISANDLIAQISAAARVAGGWSVLGKTVQCIWNTARACPECFTL